MGFFVYKTADGHVPPVEMMPDDGNARTAGQALVNGDSGLETASGDVKPVYICQANVPSGSAGRLIPVIRVEQGTIYETKNQAAFTSVAIGEHVTLHTDGAQVTATTSSTVGQNTVLSTAAEVVGFDGTAVGSRVFVRF